MKSNPFNLGFVSLIAVIVVGSRCRAEDSLVFSVPLIIAAQEPTETPQVRFSYDYSMPSGDYVAVSRYSVALYGLGLPIGKTSGIEGSLQANRDNFDQTKYWWLPSRESGIIGTVGFWHKFSDEWTGEVAYSRSLVEESARPSGFAKANFGSYSAGFKYRSDHGWRAFAGVWATPAVHDQSRSSWGPVGGIAGKYGERWQWVIGYPDTLAAYQLNRRLGFYGGVVFGGDLFNGEGVTAAPNIENFRSYRETDLKVGVVWTIIKGWTLDAGLAFPLHQRFGFSP